MSRNKKVIRGRNRSEKVQISSFSFSLDVWGLETPEQWSHWTFLNRNFLFNLLPVVGSSPVRYQILFFLFFFFLPFWRMGRLLLVFRGVPTLWPSLFWCITFFFYPEMFGKRRKKRVWNSNEKRQAVWWVSTYWKFQTFFFPSFFVVSLLPLL